MTSKKKSSDITIHWITNGDFTAGWIHTHGMDEAGLPELEMRQIPGFLAESAARILRETCDYMLDSGTRIKPGETMGLSKRTRFRLITATPILGEEDHYDVERLQIVDIEPVCENCGLKESERN